MKLFNSLLLLTLFLAITICHSHQDNQYVKFKYYAKGSSSCIGTVQSIYAEKTNLCVPSSDPTYGYSISQCTQIAPGKVRYTWGTSCNSNCSNCETEGDNIYTPDETCSDPEQPYTIECGSFNFNDYPAMLWTFRHVNFNGKVDCKNDVVRSIAATPLNTCISNGAESYSISCNSTWSEKRIWQTNSCKQDVQFINLERLNECRTDKMTFCGKK
ncbi:predicted protein [Naegleria gruberi]|uniref:Predicted protein n=1 Tax=Naegleria gruberi TaxID=5762 RepID=D2V3L1_NAEGR|nr:uncharacterized protein NAEGRDRAFT_46412 [Naegleria gruberi]EFC48790.1 predicted protein [Naegleria gruberi]|eukprot:XP_002681534.1 predicted protein [Naegleria gruberi strain NEG-M]